MLAPRLFCVQNPPMTSRRSLIRDYPTTRDISVDEEIQPRTDPKVEAGRDPRALDRAGWAKLLDERVALAEGRR